MDLERKGSSVSFGQSSKLNLRPLSHFDLDYEIPRSNRSERNEFSSNNFSHRKNKLIDDEQLEDMTDYRRRKSDNIKHTEKEIFSERERKGKGFSMTTNNHHRLIEPISSTTQKINKNTNKKRKKVPITANLINTRYEIVREMAKEVGFKIAKEDDSSCYLIWSDSFVATDVISNLKDYQRINHFPGMGEICRKDCLARNMKRAIRFSDKDFNFVPRTWVLPSEYNELQTYGKDLKRKGKRKTFIIKPSNGAMGNGISLSRSPEKIAQGEHTIVQEYIDKPLDIEGFKFDMRIYVLMTSCDPLKLFLFDDGLIRMTTQKYTQPTDANTVNKHSDNYEKSGKIDTGSKRTLEYFREYLRCNDIDAKVIWRSITDLIIKTMIVAHPHILHAYRMCRPGTTTGKDSVCFEILGFDVMLDRKLKPWLLEINRSPSFGTDEKLDYDIKSVLLRDSFKLLDIKYSDKRRNLAEQKAQAQRRLFQGRSKLETGDLQKKQQLNLFRKKEELLELLSRVKRDAARDYFEMKNCGMFQKIFPPLDRHARERYAQLMGQIHKISMDGLGKAGTNFGQEIFQAYNNPIKEEDILDKLAQCEADEKLSARQQNVNRSRVGLKPLQSMPAIITNSEEYSDENDSDNDDDDFDEVDDDDDDDQEYYNYSKNNSKFSHHQNRSRSQSRNRISYRSTSRNGRDKNIEPNNQSPTIIESDGESLKETLSMLSDMKIKFPGKDDQKADFLLDKINENWKFHKPRIASYWLVKLDSIKRQKVIDIVQGNVTLVLSKIYKPPIKVDNLRIYRIFRRLFSRLLWNHGQGLWNCFQATNNNNNNNNNSTNSTCKNDVIQNWEVIFTKSTDNVTEIELKCCRRVVELCRDCLLTVYQFSNETKNQKNQGQQQERPLLLERKLDGQWNQKNSITNYRLTKAIPFRQINLST